MTRAYLDACCLSRPFDDRGQARVRAESAAVLAILGLVEDEELAWIGSDVLDQEIADTPDRERRAGVEVLMACPHETKSVGEVEIRRAGQLAALGFGPFDALHLARAEAGAADVFLTTDDRLLGRAQRLGAAIRVFVENPAHWWEMNRE